MPKDVEDNAIKVVVRIRPFNERELSETAGAQAGFQIKAPNQIVVPDGIDSKTYGFDYLLASDKDGPCYGGQEDLFQIVGQPLLENAVRSYNGCLFAYGQTGSGKSHSVMGNPECDEQKGLLPRACGQLFTMLAHEREASGGTFQYDVLATYLEIYNEKLGDLLCARTGFDLQVRLHPMLGPHVPGVTETPVSSYKDVEELFNFGAQNRIVAATNMNKQSSRSHAIFTLEIRMTTAGKDSQAKIHFVDLAGSERQKKTGAAGDRLKEGIAINQSLSTLGKVISVLSAKKKGEVAPFRDSKLTLLLKEALSGNSKTALVACVSPSAFNLEETVSTLEFASRCKLIATSATKNEVDRRDIVQALEEEKAAMAAQLQEALAEVQATRKAIEQAGTDSSATRAAQEALDARIQEDEQREKEVQAKMEAMQSMIESLKNSKRELEMRKEKQRE